MKKSILITILSFAITHFNFTVISKMSKLIIGTGVISTATIKAQNINSYNDFSAHKIVWYITNSPSNYPGSCKIIMELRNDTLKMKMSQMTFDTLFNHTSSVSGVNQMLSLNSSGKLSSTTFSTMMIPYSQLTGTPSIPASQTVQAVPLTISGYSITANSNTVALPNPTIALGGVPLFVEVDGNITNEIQTLSGTGTQTISLSLGGGTFIIPTQTTALTSQQVTVALGAVPLFSDAIQVLSGSNTQTISLSGGGGSFTIPTQTTALTNSQVTAALGATPLFSETDPLFNTKFATKSTTDLAEGTNLYYTTARTRTTVSAGTAILYNNSTGVITNSLPDQTVIATASTGINIISSYPSFTITNSLPNQTVTITAANTDISVSGTYPNFTITPYIPTTYSVTRSINSNTFQISATRRCSAVYNIEISCTASIGSNASGKVLLQYSLDSGVTWLNASEIKNSNTVTLALALQSVIDQESVLTVLNIPAGALFRLVPTTSGTTTITYINGFETY